MDISDVFRKLDLTWLAERLKEASFEGGRAGFTKGATEAEIDLGNQPPDMGAIQDLETRAIILSDKTRERLIGNLNQSLMEGIRAREGIDDIRRRVDEIFVNMKTWETERVVRTEVLHAANNGRQNAWTRSNVISYKMWYNPAITSRRTAEDSKRMHGQIQAVDEVFVDPNGKWSGLMPPMRPNDRCSAIPLRRPPKDVVVIAGQIYSKRHVQKQALTFKSHESILDVSKGGVGSGIKGHRTYRVEDVRNMVLSVGDKEAAVLLDEKGNILAKEMGEEGTVEVPKHKATIDDRRKLELHHNHPDGSAPSQSDLNMLAHNEGIESVWAHTKDKSYKIMRGEGVSSHDLWVRSREITSEYHDKLIDYMEDNPKTDKVEAKKKFAYDALLEMKKKGIIRFEEFSKVQKAWTDEARRAALEARRRKMKSSEIAEYRDILKKIDDDALERISINLVSEMSSTIKDWYYGDMKDLTQLATETFHLDPERVREGANKVEPGVQKERSRKLIFNYLVTQEYLKRRFKGKETIKVYRGVDGDTYEKFKDKAIGEEVDINCRNVTSWTEDQDVAENFASGVLYTDYYKHKGKGVVLEIELPIKQVLLYHELYDEDFGGVSSIEEVTAMGSINKAKIRWRTP